jgi:hypothetical protein
MSSNAELFIAHLQSDFGVEDAIHTADAPDGGPPISVLVYKNIPEIGMITGVTYGLSYCTLPAWKFCASHFRTARSDMMTVGVYGQVKMIFTSILTVIHARPRMTVADEFDSHIPMESADAVFGN